MTEDWSVERMGARPSYLEAAYHWFLRAVALSCLAFGVFYWVRLLGIFPGSLWRFDLMPVHWQLASAVLSVLYPFAAVGLWLLASWGPVVWFLCAGGESLMHGGLARLYGSWDWILVVHAAVAVILIAFRVAFYIQRRRTAD